MYKLRLQTDRE